MKAIYVGSLEPVDIQVIPDSGIISRGNPFFIPEPGAWEGRILTGVRISRLGMHIPPKFASRYYDGALAAIHPVPVDGAGAGTTLEWVRDGALVAGPVTPIDQATALDPDRAAFEAAIAAVSRYVTLRTGDILLLPTDSEPLELTEGLTAILEAPGPLRLKLKVR